MAMLGTLRILYKVEDMSEMSPYCVPVSRVDVSCLRTAIEDLKYYNC